MKRIRIALVIALVLVLLGSLACLAQAESSEEEEWQADLTQLMEAEDVPSTAEITHENHYEEGVTVTTHDIACELKVDGVPYGCEFTFELVGEPVSDWDALQTWLGGIIAGAIRSAESSSEAIAEAVEDAFDSARNAALSDVEGILPEWASAQLQLKLLRVSTPFYPELSPGKNGTATEQLQERLIELGFLDDEADGYYGPNTEAAVRDLESYVRELEQDLIDARPSPTPTPIPTPVPRPTATPQSDRHTLRLRPRHTVVPSAQPSAPPAEASNEPVAPEPATRVDGVADALLQAYIFSDSYISARSELSYGDAGDEVLRLQRRLYALGCAVEEADGEFGENTARAVRIFQHSNGLEQTGVADIATQSLLFSGEGKEPEYTMLTIGSAGDAVRRLQERLLLLGFGTSSGDGDYGEATKTGVQELQAYLRGREEAELRAKNPDLAEDEDLSGVLTVAVNGIADPLLQEDFYAQTFPTVPEEMQYGASGSEVLRLQRRLNTLEYLYDESDGEYGSLTQKAVADFQSRNKLSRTGRADDATLQLLFSDSARKALKPYELRVSIDKQRVYAYAPDGNEEYTKLVRTMVCSTGLSYSPTPKGTYKETTAPGEEWHYFTKYTCWAQYTFRIKGNYLFHSVLYGSKNGSPTRSSVNNLGRQASHGCVRLSVEDAKWIYEHCPAHTTVVVY